jgi:uncharacterized protein YdhG (YjbR/CyaY superfamily)
VSVPRDVDEYLARVPDDVRAMAEQLRSVIKAAAPQAEEVISYQIPTYKLDGHLVAFGAWKNHCSLYVMSNAVLDSYKRELKPYAAEKSTLHFAIGEPVPVGLVQMLVKERLAENRAARAAKETANKTKTRKG